jgi:hypothetical protein
VFGDRRRRTIFTGRKPDTGLRVVSAAGTQALAAKATEPSGVFERCS